MTSSIRLKSVTKWYGSDSSKPVIDGIDAQIRSGEFVAILGPSGCGKTTALKIIAGLLDPSSGDVLIDEVSVVPLPPERRPVAMVFQKPLLFPHMTVADNIAFGLEVRKTSPKVIKKRVNEYLERVQLNGFAHRYPSELSGGQEQRVSLARALITSPGVLLLDEPLSQLDAKLRVEMRSLIRELQKDLGLTTILVTHDQEEAVSIADRIFLFLDSKIAQQGVSKDFYNKPASLEVAKFFGTQNLISGRVKGNTFNASFGKVQLPKIFHCKFARLVIRQEAIEIGTLGANSFNGTVESSRYQGTHSVAKVRLGLDRISVNGPPYTHLEVGQSVTLNFPPERLWVVDDLQSQLIQAEQKKSSGDLVQIP